MTQEDVAGEESAADVLDEWMDAVCREFGIERDAAARKTVLDLARVVAHTVDRQAAPLTAYLLGMAVGSGQPLGASAQRIVQIARARAKAE
jgi:hypothetical protein